MANNTCFSQEVTANYGFMEKYLATEAGIQMMLTVGQAVAGIQDKGEFHRCWCYNIRRPFQKTLYICFGSGVIIFFHREMKRTIGFVREQVENIKPFIETFKMARSFL